MNSDVMIRLLKYYKFYSVLLGASLLLSLSLPAQDNRVRILRWTDDARFDQAIYPQGSEGLPAFSERLAWNGRADELPSVTLRDAVYAPLTGDESRSLKNTIEIPDGPSKIKASVQYERKKAFVVYSILPYRKNPDNGKIEKLISFIPDIRQVPGPSPVLKMNQGVRSYASRSVLAEGKWYKIQIAQTGIHKLTYADLKKIGLQNPDKIRIYGNGGRQLPYSSGLERTDDLIENQIYIEKGTDGIFNDGDYVLFYGSGPVIWKYDSGQKIFTHRLHLYSDFAYYFLTEDLGSGKRVGVHNAAGLVPQSTVTTFDAYDFREKDSLNLIKTGRQWCWKHFRDVMPEWGFNFSFPNRVSTEVIKVTASLWARSPRTSPNSKFYLLEGATRFATVELPGVYTNNYESLYASSSITNSKFTPASDNFRINLQFLQSNPASEGWLDYLILNTRCNLIFDGGQLPFRESRETAPGKVLKYHIVKATASHMVWDVTNQGDIKQQTLTIAGDGVEFTAAADVLREYVVFDPASAKLLSPAYTGEGLGLIQNQNLHGFESQEMVILVHDDLKAQAIDLAQFHKDNSGLTSVIVSPAQIYNEFSSGMTDATAIRDFLKMFYDRSSGSPKLKYFLFFGDGSYDNKNIPKAFRTMLPTYQSLESLYPTSSYVTDDFFGLLDTGEEMEPGLLDIGIGRFPVITENEASIIIDKIRQYYSPSSLGDWRNLVCFIGDDEDGNAHMRDANTLADMLSAEYPAFNVEKIFLDAYQQISLPQGERYPEVNRAINDRMKKGALIMNYLGHGSKKGLAHEEILTVSDIKNWENPGQYPLFMTATCEFSRFDDSTTVSAGEWVLLNPTGGGIALFSTSRLVYSSPNFILNREFYNCAFKRHEDGSRYTLGDIMRLTKNAVGEEQNKLNFTLLGDPALVLSYPDVGIRMDEINGKPIGEFTDTIKALSRTTVKGHVIDLQGNKIPDFDGIVMPSVYDKEIRLTNLSNDGGPIMEFAVRNSILFRGKASVKDGEFSFNFMIPKDIAYQVGTGKFSFYGKTDTYDGHGVDQRVRIGGSEGASSNDQTGPQVGVFLNDTTFATGGICNETPVLLIRIQDESGVNTTGNGIGHDITATLDGNQQNVIVLNDYYESDLDDYRSGTIRYPFGKLSPGEHTLRVKVWDIVNNSTESELHFTVTNSDEIILDHVLNYPNPFTTRTDFYFEHNQGNQPLDVLIQVFTIGGKLVKSFEFLASDQTQINAGSFRVGPVTWDGLDDFGDRIGRGTYFYRVRVRTLEGKTKDAFQKLVILK